MNKLTCLAALFVLAACATPPPGPPAPTAALTQQAPMVLPPPEPAAAPQPAPATLPAPAALPEIVVLPPAAVPRPPPTLNPVTLVGKPRTDVLALLGGPDQARTEAGAEVFLYQGEGCTLFVFLYEPQGGGTHRVEHVELGPRGRDLNRDAACLTGLLRRAAAG
jgi:hypothetical protein